MPHSIPGCHCTYDARKNCETFSCHVLLHYGHGLHYAAVQLQMSLIMAHRVAQILSLMLYEIANN